LDAKVSVIIPTYNRCKDLYECLVSVFAFRDKPYEVIVVDSGSVDETGKLEACFPIRFVSIEERNRERARNLGVSMASGDIIAFLDDDVVVCEEWLSQIVKPYENCNVGGVGGRVIPYGASPKFFVRLDRDDIGRVFDSGLVIGNFDLPSENLIEVDSFIGCNMSFRRELLLKVGGFDENFGGTGYRDDTDLCLRVRKLGYKLMYDSQALVWHKFRGKQVGGVWSYWYVRNQVYFYFKNLFAEHRLGFPVFLYHTFLPPRNYVSKSGIKLKMESTLILNVFKGLLDGYKTWKGFSAHAG